MRRAERLFEIVQMLRGGRLRTAQRMAQHLEVSVRTIYRDLDALVATGAPIDGERGVGYILREGLLMPPLAFTSDELQALALGARLVSGWGDQDMAHAANEVLAKVDAVVAEGQRAELWRQEIQVFSTRIDSASRAALSLIRHAVRRRSKLEFHYAGDASDQGTTRIVRPLGLEIWGHAWTMTAWCELRSDFRVFRVDRITRLLVLAETFRPEAGRTLQDYMEQLKESGWSGAEAALR